MTYGYGELQCIDTDGKTEVLGEKPIPVPLCPPKIPHGPTRHEPGPPQRLNAWKWQTLKRPLLLLKARACRRKTENVHQRQETSIHFTFWGCQRDMVGFLARISIQCRSQWPRGLWRRSAGIADSNPAQGMDVCLLCLYVVFSCVGRGLCDGLITRPEESHRVCLIVCVITETSKGALCSSWEPTEKWWMISIQSNLILDNNY
jgi:hypothetical protein